MRSLVRKMKVSAKKALPESVPRTARASTFFLRTAQASEYMAEERLHTKMQWMTGCYSGSADQVVIRALTALSKSIALTSF